MCGGSWGGMCILCVNVVRDVCVETLSHGMCAGMLTTAL